LLEETEQAALKWTDELLEVERKAIGEYSEYSSEVLRMASRGSSGSDGGFGECGNECERDDGDGHGGIRARD
jgi:hypothetical protein